MAGRICSYADIAGRETVIAGTDYGFATFAGFGAVDQDIVWANLSSLSEGAAMASATLWGQLSQICQALLVPSSNFT